MDSTLHTGDQTALQAVDFSGRISDEEDQGRSVSQQRHSDSFFGIHAV